MSSIFDGEPVRESADRWGLPRFYKKDSYSLAKYLARPGQLLLPLVKLIEASRLAINELIDIRRRASIEAVFNFRLPAWPGKAAVL